MRDIHATEACAHLCQKLSPPVAGESSALADLALAVARLDLDWPDDMPLLKETHVLCEACLELVRDLADHMKVCE